MRELTGYELNNVSGGGFIGLGSVNAQIVALNGLASGGSYLWGNIIRKQESTIAGFTGSMLGGMAAGATGVGIGKAVSAVQKLRGVAAATDPNAVAATGAVINTYTHTSVNAGFERLMEIGADKTSRAMADVGW